MRGQIRATVLDHVTPEMAAGCEETFGPVAAVIRVADVEEALQVANNTEFGLGAALWTGDLNRAKTLARRIEAGAVFINGLVASDARLPLEASSSLVTDANWVNSASGNLPM